MVIVSIRIQLLMDLEILRNLLDGVLGLKGVDIQQLIIAICMISQHLEYIQTVMIGLQLKIAT